MKQITNYILENANFIVKKHVKPGVTGIIITQGENQDEIKEGEYFKEKSGWIGKCIKKKGKFVYQCLIRDVNDESVKMHDVFLYKEDIDADNDFNYCFEELIDEDIKIVNMFDKFCEDNDIDLNSYKTISFTKQKTIAWYDYKNNSFKMI